MPRIIRAPVLVQECCTRDCKLHSHDDHPTRFEKEQCPVCKRAFVASKMRVLIEQRFILVDAGPPPYELVLRYACANPKCRNLFDITEEHVATQSRCPQGHRLWEPDELKQGALKGCTTALEMAWALDEARRLLDRCPQCQIELKPVPWCPQCAALDVPPPLSCLPRDETKAWKRTFDYHESLEELQRRRQENQAQNAADQQSHVGDDPEAPTETDVTDEEPDNDSDKTD